MKLSEITPQLEIAGIVGTEPVLIIAIDHLSTDAAEVVWRDRYGTLGSSLITAADEDHLNAVTRTHEHGFDADPAWFQLGVEARRIAEAHRFDPHFAVHASAIEPLPHQITAVYEEMLPRQPLRYLLADDPGAGKTIMAGLLIKELIARGDVKRCLVVAPGSLVDQWTAEMHDKFALDFRIFNARDAQQVRGNPFNQHDLLVARLDQLSRNEDLHPMIEDSSWDLVIVDEAHRMSARRNGVAVSKTARYRLGELLADPLRTRHFLLMSATPHNGKRDDFRLLMALLDRDRYLGRIDDPLARFDAGDMMRRLVKERLVRFDGTRLFPRRIANTLAYTPSDGEARLYEAVGNYVRTMMGRAERLQDAAEGAARLRAVQVGFVLQMLQRRVASSPRAIHGSITRRRRKVAEIYARFVQGMFNSDELVDADVDEDVLAIIDDMDEAEGLRIVEGVLGDAFAAESLDELREELDTLAQLEALATAVLESGDDRKWNEVSNLLNSDEIVDQGGARRKVIIFTEHRDTLDYIEERAAKLLGSEAVASIHGGVSTRGRLEIQKRFKSDPELSVLIATDAAGEGVNLQSAHLMVNYDLPWNPNRLEQRFGRIHRIGQKHECHLWNLVATGTREGAVYQRLLGKLDQISRDIGEDGDAVYDIIGELFSEISLERFLEEAIRGDAEAAQRAVERVADVVELDRVREMLAERALTDDLVDAADVRRLNTEINRSDLVRIIPHQLGVFVRHAMQMLGGRITAAEHGRYRIERVPDSVLRAAAGRGARHEIHSRYERVCFDDQLVVVPGKPDAELLRPSHPLVTSLVDIVVKRTAAAIHDGAVLIDKLGNATSPRLLHVVEQDIVAPGAAGDAQDTVVAQRTVWVEQHPDGRLELFDHARVADYSPIDASDAPIRDKDWSWATGLANRDVIAAVATEYSRDFHREVLDKQLTRIERERHEVEARLRSEIVDFGVRMEKEQLKADAERRAGRTSQNVHQANAERYRQRALELEQRLVDRIDGFERRSMLRMGVPRIKATALVLPSSSPSAVQPLIDVRKAARKALREAGYHVTLVNCAWDIEVRAHKDDDVEWFGVCVNDEGATSAARANVIRCGGDRVRSVQVIDGELKIGNAAVESIPFSGGTSVEIAATTLDAPARERAAV